MPDQSIGLEQLKEAEKANKINKFLLMAVSSSKCNTQSLGIGVF